MFYQHIYKWCNSGHTIYLYLIWGSQSTPGSMYWTPCLDHWECHPCWSIAHCTGNIVFVKRSQWSLIWVISMHMVPPSNSRLVAEIVWILRHAKVVCCSSLTYVQNVFHWLSLHVVAVTLTVTFSPPNVDYPSILWYRGTCYSLVSLCTGYPITSISLLLSSQYLSVYQLSSGTFAELQL